MILLPTSRTERFGIHYAKPVQLIVSFQPQPTQALTLWTHRYRPRLKRCYQLHIGSKFSQHCHTPSLADFSLNLQSDITHVSHHNVRKPTQPLRTVMQAWPEEQCFTTVGGHGPGDNRNQQYLVCVLVKPQTQCVLFITHKPAALPGFDGSPSQRCSLSRITARQLFLKALVAAGRSVASINPIVWRSGNSPSSKGASKHSLTWRSPFTPIRCRNSCNCEGPGN
jgi:hypothetical protein